MGAEAPQQREREKTRDPTAATGPSILNMQSENVSIQINKAPKKTKKSHKLTNQKKKKIIEKLIKYYKTKHLF